MVGGAGVRRSGPNFLGFIKLIDEWRLLSGRMKFREITRVWTFVLPAVLMLPSQLNGADLRVDAVDAKLEKLAKQFPKQHLHKLLEYNLEKMKVVYKRALKTADDAEHRKALESSQEAWQKFFEADGRVASWNAKGGSLAYPASVQQRIYHIRARVYQLSTPFLQGWPEFPRVAHPGKPNKEKE